MSASQLRITNATTPEAQDEKTSEGSESRNSSFSGKVRLFRKCLVEKPMLFVTAFVFLVVIIWLLAAPDIPGITDRAWNREPKEQAEWKGQTEETKMTEALVETVAVSRRGQEDNTKKADTEKTEAKTAGQGRTDPFKQVKKEAVSEKEESEKPKSAIDEKAAFRDVFTESEPTKTAKPGTQNPVQESENWKEKIFGSDAGLVQDKQVFITGLSASEKEKLSFRESDFVKAVSTFLSSKRIDARTVEFLRKMDISADGAQEYLAVLPGHDDFYLVVLMYPEYPGKYILSFLDLDGLAGSLEEKEKQKKDSAPETSAVNTPVQALQTQPVLTSPPVQAPVQAQPQNTVQTEEKYDATNLTIMAVPSTLSNYLDNKYELQYTLYDYLFRNGKRGVSTAAVDDFDIDPDDRIAEITFELDDGSTVYGSYDKDSNSYSYSS